jgi:hypothetical protein
MFWRPPGRQRRPSFSSMVWFSPKENSDSAASLFIFYYSRFIIFFLLSWQSYIVQFSGFYAKALRKGKIFFSLLKKALAALQLDVKFGAVMHFKKSLKNSSITWRNKKV